MQLTVGNKSPFSIKLASKYVKHTHLFVFIIVIRIYICLYIVFDASDMRSEWLLILYSEKKVNADGHSCVKLRCEMSITFEKSSPN